MPLRHDPGEAQVDFGHGLIKFQGKLTKVAFFVMALPHSDAIYVRAYEARSQQLNAILDSRVPLLRFDAANPSALDQAL